MISFSYSDLALFILFCILIIVSGFLIVVLHRAYCVLGHVRGIFAAHHEDIGSTLSKLPEVLTNVNQLAVSLKETAEQTNYAFRSLQEELTDTVGDLREGFENCAFYIKLIGVAWKAISAENILSRTP